jgi:type VII secretion-associated protein (TIGR03931 family)
MTLAAVALAPGAATVRVAGVEPGGVPRLLAELPAPAEPAEVIGPPPDDLVLVHPVRWTAEQVADHARSVSATRTVPASVAAAAGTGARAVLDVGYSGAEATLLCGEEVVAHRWCPVGGAALDEVLVGDPRIREALSLLPVVDGVHADALRAAITPLLREVVALLDDVEEGPVLLVGGVARTPLLAELVDAAGVPGAVVAPRPDAAAVLGALTLPPTLAVRARAAQARASWLGPVPSRRVRPGRVAAAALAGVGVGAALLGAGRMLAPSARVAPSGVLVQYGYRLDVPAGWEHTGGLPERRRTLLTPVAAPEGSDLLAVERTPLGYDTGAEPERARAELRAVFDEAVARGSALSDFKPSVTVAGRTVATYRQQMGSAAVDWFVVLDGDAQLSVGCQHTRAGAAAVRAACEVVVGSVRRE